MDDRTLLQEIDALRHECRLLRSQMSAQNFGMAGHQAGSIYARLGQLRSVVVCESQLELPINGEGASGGQ